MHAQKFFGDRGAWLKKFGDHWPAGIPTSASEGKRSWHSSQQRNQLCQALSWSQRKPARDTTPKQTPKPGKMQYLHLSSRERILVLVIAEGGKLLLGRNTVFQGSFSACKEIGRKRPGLKHKAKASEKLPPTQHKKPNEQKTQPKPRPQWIDHCSTTHPKDALPCQTAPACSFLPAFQMIYLFSSSFIWRGQPEAQQDHVIALS